eukprot:TRINITY_DN7205_c0_g1_i1.p1 TRINITY_DN7205_c0_g1~~TRINITY_DN7205_c0_g1_i1.p1  ORF type:complete len:277 (+),score=27.97 TRINITY_DN7205_c0_g1_i1:112-942(+)
MALVGSRVFRHSRPLFLNLTRYPTNNGNIAAYRVGEAHWEDESWSASYRSFFDPEEYDSVAKAHFWHLAHGLSGSFTRYEAGELFGLPDYDYSDGAPSSELQHNAFGAESRVEWNRMVLQAVLKAELAHARGGLPAVSTNRVRRRQSFVAHYVDATGKVRDAAGDVVGDFVTDSLGFSTKSTKRYLRQKKHGLGPAIRPSEYAAVSKRAPRTQDQLEHAEQFPGTGQPWWSGPTEAWRGKAKQASWGTHFDDPIIIRGDSGEPFAAEDTPNDGKVF